MINTMPLDLMVLSDTPLTGGVVALSLVLYEAFESFEAGLRFFERLCLPLFLHFQLSDLKDESVLDGWCEKLFLVSHG